MFVIMLRNISFIPDTIHIYPYLIMNLVFRYRFINSSKKAEVYESTVFLECRSDYDSVDHYLFIRKHVQLCRTTHCRNAVNVVSVQ